MFALLREINSGVRSLVDRRTIVAKCCEKETESKLQGISDSASVQSLQVAAIFVACLPAFELVPGERKATAWKKYLFRAMELWLGKNGRNFLSFSTLLIVDNVATIIPCR